MNARKTSSRQSAPAKAAPPLVVGVGASAGGLQAFQELLSGLGSEPGVAIIFVQHLDPASPSLLPELLAKWTNMETVEISADTKLARNTVYICPPHQVVTLEQSQLRISPAARDKASSTAIDDLFHSLAEDQAERGIGVVLSGSGSDGTLGLKAISDHGGVTFAQDSTSAKFTSMPRNAATFGVADHVLPPAEIATELLRYVEHLNRAHTAAIQPPLLNQIEDAVPTIAETLRKVTDHNFLHYKTNMLVRRVLRRMHVLKFDLVGEYLEFLQTHESESQALFRELLIGVTTFFRDPEAFEALSRDVLPQLFEDPHTSVPVRIWVAGCANGAEAYTLAILCREAMEAAGSTRRVQIFATDIDPRGLQIARDGTYPVGIEEQLTPERLQRFFVKQAKQYQVRQELREMVLFSSHNLISDPPFSRLDLISCRNLLIYLGSHLQDKLIPLFHYALRPSGFLFLGPSESIAAHGELFQPLDLKHRISQRKGTTLGQAGAARLAPMRAARPHTHDRIPDAAADLTDIRQRILLDEFAPKSCIVNEAGQVLNAAANMHKYLSLGDGDFQNSVVKMAASGLRVGLRAALTEAKQSLRKVQHENLSIRLADQVQRVMLTVQPMPRLGEDEQLFMVVFHDVGLPVDLGQSDAPRAVDPTADSLLAHMERELEATRLDLDRSMQDMEATNQELKSSNEELRSLNEELQSANEELESSKEEIRLSVEALSRANSDLENLFRSTQIATLFLDLAGNIIRFTPATTDIYNLIPADVGRRLSDITHRVAKMPALPSAERLGGSLKPIEHEIHAQSGRWYLRRVLPYLRHDQADGMIINFIDITEHKQSLIRSSTEHQVSKLLARADSLEATIPKVLPLIRQALDADYCGLWVPDASGQELLCNDYSVPLQDMPLKKFAEANTQLSFSRGKGLPGRVWESLTAEWIENLAGDGNFYRSQATAIGLTSGMALPIVVGSEFFGAIEIFTRARLPRDTRLLMMLESIGAELGQSIQRKQLDASLRDEEARKSAILASALDAIITMNMDGCIVDFNPAAEQIFGHRAADVQGRLLADVIIPHRYRDAHSAGLNRFLETGQSRIIGQRLELTALKSDGCEFPIELAVGATQTLAGVPFFTAYLRDLTQRDRAQRELVSRERQLSVAMEAGRMGSWLWDISTGRISWTDRLHEMYGYTRDEFGGTPQGFLEIVVPEDRPLVEAVIDSILNGASEREHFEVRTVRGTDGATIWTDIHGLVERTADGKPVRITGFALETTDRKRRELSLAFQAALQLDLARIASGVEIVQLATQRITEYMQLSRCMLVRIDEEVTTAEVFYEHSDSGLASLVGTYAMQDFWSPAEQEQFRLGQVIVINDTRSGARTTSAAANFAALGIAALSCAPASSDRQLRFLLCATKAESYVWRNDEIELLRDLSTSLFLRLEQARAEAAVRASESHLRRVINNQLGLVGVIGRDGQLLEVDDRSVTIAGLQRSDVIGKHFSQCAWWTYDPEVAAMIHQSMEQALAGQRSRFDVPLYAAGLGDPRQRLMIDFMIAPVKDASDRVEYLIFSGVDISDRVAAERLVHEQAEKLAEGNRRLSLAITAGDMAVWEWTPAESVWEPSMYSLLGIPPDTPASTEQLYRCAHPDDLAGLRAAWEQATNGLTDFYDHEFRIVRPDGEIRWIAGVGDVFRNHNGQVLRIHGLNRDITSQRELQESLLQARAMAEAANASKSEFLANMSHEIRTPMTAILGYTELIAEQLRDPGIAQYVQTIKRNGEFLLEIINDILDLSKIEADKFELDKVRFAPSELVDDVRAIMEVRAKENHLSLHVQYAGPIPAQIESDPKRLKQILINLVGNAIKFTDQGGVKIIVRYRPGPVDQTVGDAPEYSDQGELQFDVIDTGIGMSEEQQQRLFRPFSQGDASITRSFGGTGLGLAISQRLAKMLGGEISVKSQLGQGSQFSVKIGSGNVRGVALLAPPVAIDSQEGNTRPKINLNCHVLVVDDRRDIRFLSKHFLEQAGAKVSEAEDGQQGVAIVANALATGETINLILLDMQMPKLDGYQTARALRQLGFTAPIIALTADAMQGDMTRCIECGCNNYLSKPINREAMLHMIQRYLPKTNH